MEATLASLQDLAVNYPWALAASMALVSGTAAYMQSQHYKLRHIPTVGTTSLPLLSYIDGRRYFHHAQEIYQEGYERYPGRMFKVATMDRWLVFATGRRLVREIAAMPDDTMSFMEGINILTEQKYTVGTELQTTPIEIDLIRRDLTRNLTTLFPEIYEEIEAAFNEYIPKSDDWNPMPALNITMMVVARASNRVLVGLPYCRNMEFLQNCITYTKDWSDSSNAITKWPSFMKPIVAPYLNKLPATVKRVAKIIGPEVDRRRALMEEYGLDYPGKTNDFLSWLMDATHGDPKMGSTRVISHRILQVNFAALHTSSSTFTHALYTLAANPEWIAPLRTEIEEIVTEEGGLKSKAAMQKMVKLDSFFRECNRTNTIVGMAMTRLALKSHTFSDGTFIPKGTILGVPPMPHQLDGENYERPTELDPFRFENAKEGDATRKYFTSVDSEYISFGLGKHACPGRFFAGNELKAMMAHLLINYDIRAEVEGVRPKNLHLGQAIMPDMQAKVLFRKRQA